MKKLLIFATFAMLFAACDKETPCNETLPGVLTVKNTMHVRMECILIYPTRFESFGLNPSESITRSLQPETYLLTAEGKDGGPYAHNTYTFSEYVKVGGCAGNVKVEIE